MNIYMGQMLKNITPVSNHIKRHIKRYGRQFALICSAGFFSMGSMAHHDAKHENAQRQLLIELTPAMCALYPIRTNSIQCLHQYHVTAEGLDLGYRCASSSTPQISPVQRRVLHRIMPDRLYVNQAWRRYGACSPYDSRSYFRQLIDLSERVNIPLRLTASHSFVISKSLFLEDMHRANPDIMPHHIQLTCEPSHLSQPILTKMKICYEASRFANCPSVKDSCGENFIIWGSAQ